MKLLEKIFSLRWTTFGFIQYDSSFVPVNDLLKFLWSPGSGA